MVQKQSAGAMPDRERQMSDEERLSTTQQNEIDAVLGALFFCTHLHDYYHHLPPSSCSTTTHYSLHHDPSTTSTTATQFSLIQLMQQCSCSVVPTCMSIDTTEYLYTSIRYTRVYRCIDTHHSSKAVSRFPPQGTCHQGCLPSGHKRLSPPLWHGRLCDCFPGLEEPCELPSGRRCSQRILHDLEKS